MLPGEDANGDQHPGHEEPKGDSGIEVRRGKTPGQAQRICIMADELQLSEQQDRLTLTKPQGVLSHASLHLT